MMNEQTDYQMGFKDGLSAARRTPDPRVMELVEALKGCIDAYDFCSDDPADSGWSVLDGAVADARTALSAFNGDGK